MEFSLSGPEHFPEVGTTEAALVSAAGFAHDVIERPAMLTCRRGKDRKGHPAADAAGDIDGMHFRKRNAGTGDWGLGTED